MQCPRCSQPIRDGSKFCNNCGLSLVAEDMPPGSPAPSRSVDEWMGRQLGNYRLINLLGEGGFARVYLGEHIHLSTQAAIKVLHTQLASTEDVHLFRQEARTIAGLNHPNVVRVLDFGVEGSAPYLVMDYATNGSLRTHHPKGTRLPLETVWRYVRQVADALQYAHEQKLIHRDIKPENMLLGRKQEVLLTDFGIALVAQSSRYENTQSVAGTAAYMAPEQLQGRPRPASDLYSLGVVVYEWLCGERPFHGSFTEIASQHLFTPPAPLRAKVPELPLPVEDVVLTALAKDPKERFATARAFANAFEQAIHPGMASAASFSTDLSAYWTRLSAPPANTPRPTMPGSPTPAEPQAPPAGGIPTPSGSGAAPAPSGGAAGSWYNAPTQLKSGDEPGVIPPPIPPPTPPPILETPNESKLQPLAEPARKLAAPRSAPPAGEASFLTSQLYASGQPGASVPPLGTPMCIYHGHSNEVMMVAWLAGGKQLVSSGGDNTVQVWESSSGETRLAFAGQPLDGPASGRAAVISADRTRIATLNEKHQIQILDLASVREIVTYRGHQALVSALAWSPDGQRVVSGGQDNTIQVWDAQSGEMLATYRIHAALVSAVVWSPDGRRIASADADGRVRMWDFTSKSTTFTYSEHKAKVHLLLWSPDGRRVASASHDGTVQVWDALKGKKIVSYSNHPKSDYPVAWSPDGKQLASFCTDEVGTTVRVWDGANGRTVAFYSGHSGPVHALAWSPDGGRITSAGKDGKVHIWNASTATKIFAYADHKGAVHTVAWSPDGKLLASAGQDGKVHVWHAEQETVAPSVPAKRPQPKDRQSWHIIAATIILLIGLFSLVSGTGWGLLICVFISVLLFFAAYMLKGT